MIRDTQNDRKQRDDALQSTAELLCLLATYEAYGIGVACSGCLRALAAKAGAR